MATDLNGMWRDADDFPVQITHKQKENSVVAKWLKVPYLCDPGNGQKLTAPTAENFEAKLSGNALKGKTITCSRKGLVYADMTLQVKQNGDVLEGTYHDAERNSDLPITIVRCRYYLSQLPTKTLEDHDNKRWTGTLKQKGADSKCFYWPASFYLPNNLHAPSHADFHVPDTGWITGEKNFQQMPSGTSLELGDTVIFQGKPTAGPGVTVAHVAIATGLGDEVSQLWWTRDVRLSMHSNGKIIDPPSDQPAPQSGGYAVTRDKLAALISEFTDAKGQKYFFDKYEIWRRKDQSFGSFTELGEDLCLDCGAQHIVKAPAGASRLPP